MSRPAPSSTSEPRKVWLSVAVRGVITLAIIAFGFAIFGGLYSTREEAKRVTEPLPPRVVQTVTVATRSIPRAWPAYGTARALVSTELPAEVASVVAFRPKEMQAGVHVERGETIVRLDEHDFEQNAIRAREAIAALEAQLAGLDIEEASWRRRVELADESVLLAKEELNAAEEAQSRTGVGDIEVNRQRRSLIVLEREAETTRDALLGVPPRRMALLAQVALERANLRLAERNIERCTIAAPYDARVQRLDAQEGERVAPGEPVARLVSLAEIEVPLRVAIASSESIRVGDPVRLRASNDSGLTWAGRVSRVAPEADASSRSITVYAVVEQDPEATDGDALLLPGQFVAGEVLGRVVASALPIPRSAIDEDRVLIVTPGGAIDSRPVEVAFYLDGAFPEIAPDETQWAVVSGGLAPGERVVVTNLDELKVGMTVTATDTAPLSTARANNGKSEG